jgi:hypothetical protein
LALLTDGTSDTGFLLMGDSGWSIAWLGGGATKVSSLSNATSGGV